LLHALLDAFEQDVRHTDVQHRYANTDELLHYCERSANPVGRLLLHLHGVTDTLALQRSDAICSALQLINFWQDLSADWPRQRHYLPRALLQQHGVDWADFSPEPRVQDMAQRQVVQTLCTQARSLMQQGAPLVHQVPGRMGWELRAVVQGGLRVLDHIEALQHRTWLQRPTLRSADGPLCLWRALTM
jgi:squalene synthase HpnC